MCLKLMKPSREDDHGLALLTRMDQGRVTESRNQHDRRRSSSRTDSRRSQVSVEAGSRRGRRSPSPGDVRTADEIRDGRRRVAARSVERRTERRSADSNRRTSETGIRRVVTDRTENSDRRASLRVETRRVTRTERDERVVEADRRRERSPPETSGSRRSSRKADERVRSAVEFVRSRRTSVTERRDASAKERMMARERIRSERRVSSAERRVSSQDDSERTQKSSRIDRRISSAERKTPSPDFQIPQQSSRTERRVSSSERKTPSYDTVRSERSSRIERSVSFVERRTPSPVAAARTEKSSRIERRSHSSEETTRSASRTERTRQLARLERRVASVEVRYRQTSRVERRGISAERRAQDSREHASRIDRRISSSAEETARSSRTQRRIAPVENRSRTERRVSLSAERARSSTEPASTRRLSRSTRSPVSADRRMQPLSKATTVSSRFEERRTSTTEATHTARMVRGISAAERRSSPEEFIVSAEVRLQRSRQRRTSSSERRTLSPTQASRSDRRSLSRERRTSEATSSQQSSRRTQERTDVRIERRVSSADGRIQSRLDRRTDRLVASSSMAETTRPDQSSMSDRRLKRSASVSDERTVESLSRSSVTRRLKSGTERREELRTISQRRLKTETAAREDNVERRTARRFSADNSRRLSEETVAYRRSGSGERSESNADSSRRVRVGSEMRSARRFGERLIRTRDRRADLGPVRVSGKSDSTRQIRRIASGDEASLHRQSSALTRVSVNEKSPRRVVRVDGYDTLERSSLNGLKSVDVDNLQERRNLRVSERSQRSASRESLYRRMVNILPYDSRLERRQQETRNLRRISASTRRYQGERQKENLQRKSTNEARRLVSERMLTTSRRTALAKLSFNDLQTDERRTQAANKPLASMRKVERESAEGKSSRTRETLATGERREISLKVRASDVSRETQTRRNMRTDMEARRRSPQEASVRQSQYDQRRQKERADSRTNIAYERRGLSKDVADNSHRSAHENNALSVRNSRVSMTRFDGSRRRMVSDHAKSQEYRQQRRVGQVLQRRSSDVPPTDATRVHRGSDARRSASESRVFARSSRGTVDTVETIRTVRSSTLERHSRLATSDRRDGMPSERLARKALSTITGSDGLRRLQHGHDSSDRSNRRTTRRTVDVREDENRRHVKHFRVFSDSSRVKLVDRDVVSRRESRLPSKPGHLTRISDSSRRSISDNVLERVKKSVKRSDERHGVTIAITRARSIDGRRLSDKASREDTTIKSYRHEEPIRENESRRRSVDSRRASSQSGKRNAFSPESRRNFRALISSLSTFQSRNVRDVYDKEGPRYSRRSSSRNDELTRRSTKVEDSHTTAAATKDFKTEENQLSVPAFARPDLKDNDVPDNYVSYVLAAILIGATIFYDSLVNSSLGASLPDLDRPKEIQPSVEVTYFSTFINE